MSEETDKFTDDDYRGWVKKLDSGDLKKGELSEWAQGFVSGNVTRATFSEKQRKVILDLVEKHL